MPHGHNYGFWKDGGKWFSHYLNNGKRVGRSEVFRQDGTIEERTNYENDERHGLHEEYNPDGSLIKRIQYVNGEKVN